MSGHKLARRLFWLFILCLVISALPGGPEGRKEAAMKASFPKEFHWVMFLEDGRNCTTTNMVIASDGSAVAKFDFCPIRPGDQVGKGDYLVDKRFLVPIPDKEGTIVARYAGQVIFRRPFNVEPFADDQTPVAVIIYGETKTTWIDDEFREQTEVAVNFMNGSSWKAAQAR